MLQEKGSSPDCAVMQHATMHYELFGFVFPPVVLLSFQLSLFISSASDGRATVHFPPCNLSICRNGPCVSECVFLCVCVCVCVCAHWVIGNVVFKGDDCSGPRGLQADKVMMAATFSASSSQSPWSELECVCVCVCVCVCLCVCVLSSMKWT